MKITIRNDEPGFSNKRLAVVIKKKDSIVTRVLAGGESMTKEVDESWKITAGQKWEGEGE
jgi:hypothetical protein